MAKESSNHEARVAEHVVWDALRILREQSAAILESEEPDGAAWARRHDRVEYVLDHVRTRIRQADPQLVSLERLEAIRGAASNASEQLENFTTNGQSSHLDAADKQVDELLAAAAGLPPLPPSEEAETAMRAVARLGDLIEQATSEGKTQVSSLRERGEEVEQAHATELEQRDNRMNELDGQIQELKSALAETKEQLATAEEEERSRWSEAASTTLDEIKDLREQASNLVTAKAAEVVAGGYMGYADQQRHQANGWRWASVAFALLAAIFLMLVFFTQGDDATVASAIRAGLTAAALFAIAGYAGKQSASHRSREQRAYKSGLEVTAIEPFLANLPEDEKARARRVFAEHFFSQPVEEKKPAKDDEPVTNSQLFSLFREML